MKSWYISKTDGHWFVWYADSTLRLARKSKGELKRVQYKELLKRFPRWFLGLIRRESKKWDLKKVGYAFRMW